jgi:hypothetical protein
VDRAGESRESASPAFSIFPVRMAVGKNYKPPHPARSSHGPIFLFPKLRAYSTLGRPEWEKPGRAPTLAQLLLYTSGGHVCWEITTLLV